MAVDEALLDKLTRDPDFLKLSEADQDQMYEELSGQQAKATRPSIPFVPGYNRVEEAIANRGSGIGFLRAAARDPSVVRQHPLITALSALGLPLEAGESTAANMLLALQRGQPQDIGRDVTAGLRGERPAQFGDVFRSVNVPEPVSSVLGLTLMPGGAQLEEALGRGAVNVVQRGASGVATGGRKIVEFLRGNPKAIQAAKGDLNAALKQSAKQLDSDAYDAITSYRRGGSEHAGFFKQHGQLSDEAWEPVKQVARGVTQPIPIDELKATISTQYADDPAFAGKAHAALDGLFPAKPVPESPILFGAHGKPVTSASVAEPNNVSAEYLIQKLTDFNKQVRAAVHRGTVPRNAGEQLIASIRSAAAQAIEAHAPGDVKGLYQEGLNNWASHAADTRRLFRILKPGAPLEEPTAEGVNFLKKAVTGGFDADRDTTEFINRVRDRYGIDLTKAVSKSGQPIQQAEDALRKAQQIGKRGEAVRQLGQDTLKLGAAGSILRFLFGHHE